MSLDIWIGDGEPSFNYTHNVVPMWKKAGCYDALYESSGLRAKEVLLALKLGLMDMLGNPAEYTALNPENGWGDYESATHFLVSVIIAFAENPDAIIGVSA